MKFFGKKKDKMKPGTNAGQFNMNTSDDKDEVELACRDLMLASLENMRKEVIPGKRNPSGNDDLDSQYQEIADFINQKVDELEAEIPEKIALESSNVSSEIPEDSSDDDFQEQEDVSEPVSEKIINMEPIEQEFSLSPNKQLIIDQITAFDIESAVTADGSN